tara:strand:- start:432 stop:641 length:210 start_codon:yes stop_codon:yes gene_type:complete
MFKEKLQEAHDILDKAVAILIKEEVINFEMDANNWTPDHANDNELLSDLQDIQLEITKLKYRFIDIPIS